MHGPTPRPPDVVCPLLMLFSPALTAAVLLPPNALAFLCLRSPVRRGPPSPKPTYPWSLLQTCRRSLARAASGPTPAPLPGTAGASQPGVRYPAPLGPGGQGRREWDEGSGEGARQDLEPFLPCCHITFPAAAQVDSQVRKGEAENALCGQRENEGRPPPMPGRLVGPTSSQHKQAREVEGPAASGTIAVPSCPPQTPVLPCCLSLPRVSSWVPSALEYNLPCSGSPANLPRRVQLGWEEVAW